MSQIFNALTGLITPDLISKAASMLGEDKSKVTSAVGSIVPSILGSILAKGNDPKLESVLTKAGKEHDSILSNITGLFSGEGDEKIGSIGTSFLNSILGDKLGGLTSLISGASGISGDGIGKLISMVAPLVAGFLGKKMSLGGLNLSGLLGMLSSEKDSFLGAIPSGLTSILGIPSLASLGSNLTSGISNAAHGAEKVAQNTMNEAKKGSSGMMKWLLLAAGLIAAFFIWKRCQNPAEEAVTAVTNEVTTTIDAADSTVNETLEKISEEFTLPNGEKVKGYKGGIEDQIITFLNSDEYKNATPELLKEKWFSFDNIDFKHGSATELTEGSHPQLNNLISILKDYKNTHIKIGGYTDKSGNPEANMKLSQERANTIKGLFEKGGIDAKRLSAEGYGDKFAKYSADAPDSERVLDRKIALRFEK